MQNGLGVSIALYKFIRKISKKGNTVFEDFYRSNICYNSGYNNLNIAQVKQKHGIIERENYNKAKSVDSKQPECPEEKVKAIEDAMRNFQMI